MTVDFLWGGAKEHFLRHGQNAMPMMNDEILDLAVGASSIIGISTDGTNVHNRWVSSNRTSISLK